MKPKYLILMIDKSGEGADHLMGVSHPVYTMDVPYTSLDLCIHDARDYMAMVPSNGPAQDYYVIDMDGDIVWRHPKNKGRFQGPATVRWPFPVMD